MATTYEVICERCGTAGLEEGLLDTLFAFAHGGR